MSFDQGFRLLAVWDEIYAYTLTRTSSVYSNTPDSRHSQLGRANSGLWEDSFSRMVWNRVELETFHYGNASKAYLVCLVGSKQRIESLPSFHYTPRLTPNSRLHQTALPQLRLQQRLLMLEPTGLSETLFFVDTLDG